MHQLGLGAVAACFILLKVGMQGIAITLYVMQVAAYPVLNRSIDTRY
jgi:hypothetical protein